MTFYEKLQPQMLAHPTRKDLQAKVEELEERFFKARRALYAWEDQYVCNRFYPSAED